MFAALSQLSRVALGLSLGAAIGSQVTQASELPGFDYDANGRVDQVDFEAWLGCHAGPHSVATCDTLPAYVSDRDQDDDVDMADFAALQRCFSGDQPAVLDCTPPLPPRATLSSATGHEDVSLVILLTAIDPQSAPPMLTFTILELPASGTFSQFDGTPISIAPAPVTDPAGSVRFLGAANASGAGTAQFAYNATSAATGLSSLPRDVTIDLAAVNDPPMRLPQRPSTNEDTPITFEITATDPDLPNDTLTLLISSSPARGSMYQVAESGQPLLSQLILPGTFVTNSQRLVHYVPDQNVAGTDTFTAQPFDALGATSVVGPTAIDVVPVNDAPTAIGEVFAAPHQLGFVGYFAQVSDVDGPIPQVCIATLPQHGTLYVQGGPAITEVPTCVSTTSFRYVPDSVLDGMGCDPPGPGYAATFPRDIDSFEFYAFDGAAASPTATATFRLTYGNTPPYYTGATEFTLVEDGEVVIPRSAIDIDGDTPRYRVLAPLPTHGTLFANNFPITTAPVVIGVSQTLRYVPADDFNADFTPPDVVRLELFDVTGVPRACVYELSMAVTAVNDAPQLSGPLSLNAIVIAGEGVVPAATSSLAIADDAGPTDLLSVSLRAEGSAAAGIALTNAAGLQNVQQVSATVLTFEGTLAAINLALSRGVVWTPSEIYAESGTLVFEVNDLGSRGAGTPNPLTTTLTIPVSVSLDEPFP